MMVPWDEDTPDSRGFWQYVKRHWSRCDELACEIVIGMGFEVLRDTDVYCVVLEKLASPLVYLYEAWVVMAPEKKAKYSEELAKIHEESKRMAEEAFK